MKYFDKLSADVESAFGCRGVNTESLKYCVKADLDGEGCYYDVYIAFDGENLYMLSGYDRLKKKGKHYDTGFDFKEFAEYPVKDIERLSVDRYTYTSRLMARFADGKEMPLARFSAGYGEKFEQFCRRFECLKKGETPDDSSLEVKHLYCPKCGEKYPDPNRRYCPHCTKKSSIFKRLLGLFADNKKPMFIILALIWLSVGLELAAPYFGTKLLYDDVLTEGGRLYGQILYVILCMAAFSFISMLFRMVSGIVLSRVTPQVIHKLRVRIFCAMQRLSLSFFTNKQTGSLMGRVDNDSFDVYGFIVDVAPQFLSNIVKVIGLVVTLSRL